MKIISLQSVGLGDYVQDGSTGELVPTQRWIYIGEPFNHNPYGPDSGSDPKVIKIRQSYDEKNYVVDTSDKHMFILPADKYIAEYVEVDE